MPRETWAQDARDDAGSHALNRSQRKTRGKGQRRRGNRGNFLRNMLGRGHHGLLGGGLLQHLSTLMTLIGLLSGLFKHHKHVHRGGATRRPRTAKVVRARSSAGIRRPAASAGVRSSGRSAPTGRVASPKAGAAYYLTGVFSLRTLRPQRKRVI